MDREKLRSLFEGLSRKDLGQVVVALRVIADTLEAWLDEDRTITPAERSKDGPGWIDNPPGRLTAAELEDAALIWGRFGFPGGDLEPRKIRDLVKEQIEDEGLWFKATTAPEAYLQQELRRLHCVLEGLQGFWDSHDAT